MSVEGVIELALQLSLLGVIIVGLLFKAMRERERVFVCVFSVCFGFYLFLFFVGEET